MGIGICRCGIGTPNFHQCASGSQGAHHPDQMPPHLPNELLELIVEHLALKPREECIQQLLSCSLANSFLAPLCQKEIFRNVTLWIHVPVEGRSPSAETVEYQRRASLLIQAINQNPSLGGHVQHLSHFVTSTPPNQYEGLDDLLSVFKAMPNIVELELGHRLSAPSPGSGRGTGLGFNPRT
jgi:hypothetical protein